MGKRTVKINKKRFSSLVLWSVGLHCLSLSAASVKDLEAKAAASIAAGEKIGHTRGEVTPPKDPHIPSDAEKTAGIVVFQQPITQFFDGRGPEKTEGVSKCDLSLARDEASSFRIAAYALKNQPDLHLKLRRPLPEGLKNSKVSVHPLIMAPYSRRKRVQRTGEMKTVEGQPNYSVYGVWLADNGPVSISKRQARAWFVCMELAADAKPGAYSLALEWYAGGHSKPIASTPVSLKVYPFKLVQPADHGYVFGTFAKGAGFNLAQFKQMKAHGIDGLQWFWGHWGLDIRKVKGKLKLDFTRMDRMVDKFKQAGLHGPLIISLGNSRYSHFEKQICKLFRRPMQKRAPLARLDDKVTEALMIEALKQLFDHARAKQWPELVLMPYDEPTSRLIKEYKRIVKIMREHFPKIRIYGCSMARLRQARQVADADIIVSNGDTARIRALTREMKIQHWVYGVLSAGYGFGSARKKFGWRPFAYGADGVWNWSYNYYTGNPWNSFDGARPDASYAICWPPFVKDGPGVESYSFQGLREGVNDVRYALTLEAALEKNAGDAKAEAIKKEYQQLKSGLRGKGLTDTAVSAARKRIVQFILTLMRN